MIPLDKHLITGRQIAAARTLLGMVQAELASRSAISVPTLKRMEGSEGHAAGLANNVAAVRAALEAAGIEFTNGEQPGVRLSRAKPNEGTDMDSTAASAEGDARRRPITIRRIIKNLAK